MGKKKYVIIPVRNYHSEPIEAESAQDALISFATTMDTNMGIYFKAVPEDELPLYLMRQRAKIAEEMTVEFMLDELMSSFGLTNESAARDIANRAYSKYLEGSGKTEYECIQWAYDNFVNAA